MNITVNGHPKTLATDATLADLVASLNLPIDGIAAAIDGQVVPKSEHDHTVLTEGCVVEIIRAVGGG